MSFHRLKPKIWTAAALGALLLFGFQNCGSPMQSTRPSQINDNNSSASAANGSGDFSTSSGSQDLSNLIYNPVRGSLCSPSECDVYIETADDFEKIKNNLFSGGLAGAKRYCVIKDLDFSGRKSPEFGFQFSYIEVNGCGHSIKNLFVTSQPLFISLWKSSIKNFRFENLRVFLTPTSKNDPDVGIYNGRNIGFLAGTIRQSSLKNLNIQLDSAYLENKTSPGGTKAGLIAGAIENTNVDDISISGKEFVAKNLGNIGILFGSAGVLEFDLAGLNFHMRNINVNLEKVIVDNFAGMGGAVGSISVGAGSGSPAGGPLDQWVFDGIRIQASIEAGNTDLCTWVFESPEEYPCRSVGGIIGGASGLLYWNKDYRFILTNSMFKGHIRTQGVVAGPAIVNNLLALSGGVGGLMGSLFLYELPTRAQILNSSVDGQITVLHSKSSAALAVSRLQEFELVGGRTIGGKTASFEPIMQSLDFSKLLLFVNSQKVDKNIGKVW